MLGPLLALDRYLFRQANQVWTCRLLDAAMPVLTDIHRRPLFLAAAALGAALWVGKRRAEGAKALGGLALTVGASDLFCFRVLKPFFHRARPTAAGVVEVLRAPAYGALSFPSNHAANCFAGAAFLASLYPALAAPLYAAAFVVAYSRVYVGVHYPADVAFGALIGLAWGLLTGRLLRAWIRRGA